METLKRAVAWASAFADGTSIRELLRFRDDPLGVMIDRHRNGGTQSFLMAGRQFVYLAEPEDLEWMLRQRSDVLTKDAFMQELRRIAGNGLLVSEGDFWRKQRGLMAHAFTPKRIKSYGEAMAVIADRFASGLVDGQTIDVHDAMNQLTMQIVAKTLFDSDVTGRGAEVGHALAAIMDFYANSPEAVLQLPDWFPSKRMRGFVAARDTVRSIIDEIIRDRRTSGEDRGDLLGAMLNAAEADGTKMTDEHLRDELLTLFLAGYETTSLLLAHTFILLSRHPEVAAKLRAEANAVLGHRTPTSDDARALVYSEQVLSEALRLYPSAWALGREVVGAIELGGRTLTKGTQLIASPWAMHRDPRFFPNPEAFLPERFTPEARKRIPRGAYIPFGDGPRVCIGQHFAMLEAILVLSSIVRRVDLELLPGERLEFAPSVTLRAKKGIRMRVRKAEPLRPAVVELAS